jgi:adenosylhomocysteine nucleosidase
MLRNRALIVSALPVEAKAILSFFEDVHVQSTPKGVSYMTGNRKIFSAKLGEKIEENWAFFIAAPTGAGNLEVTRALHQMIPECNPHIVALIGCAGGFPDKIEQYDVVVAPRVDYIARTKVSRKTQLRPQQEVCSSMFVDHCKNVQLLDLWHQYLHPDITNAPINVQFEPIVSGETVLANSRSAYFRLAQIASPKAVAIEMEGYGFLSACREYKVEAAVVQGISDTLDDKDAPAGDGRSSNLGLDKAQYKATRHAAALFFATLDFVDSKAFRKRATPPKDEITEVSMIIDAEMHDVAEIQADLFELFKKYGIRNFTFKPANSVRVGFRAQLSSLRIYEALIAAGIIDRVAGFRVRHFEVKTDRPQDRQLADILSRIRNLRGASLEDALHAIRNESWLDHFPDHAPIVVDALEHQRNSRKSSHKRTGRILYPVATDASREAQVASYFGPSATSAMVLADPSKLHAQLTQWRPAAAEGDLLRWFMGSTLLDRDVAPDILLAHSKQKFFYSWPRLGMLYEASSLAEKDFIDGCTAEWHAIRRDSGPSILQLLDEEKSDRLGRGQIRDAMRGQPATLSKSLDILTLTCRILSQNKLPVRGCIIPSLYVLAFNGTIAGDGTVERMLLTGMAGDLVQVATESELSLRVVQSALRGDTLPFRAASALTSVLDRVILSKTKLVASTWVLDADDASRRRREAVPLDDAATRLYVSPLA